MATPVRTCIGCGARVAPGELVRLRLEGAQVMIDARRQGGRGAWLHASAECLARAVKRRAFDRAFRGASGPVDAAALRVGLTGSARKD